LPELFATGRSRFSLTTAIARHNWLKGDRVILSQQRSLGIIGLRAIAVKLKDLSGNNKKSG
jgi:hypothetical protein